MLLEPRRLLELGQGRHRVPAERARPLGHIVDEVVELLVLRGEELVQVVELRADDVPVVVAGLRVEHVLVSEQGVQDPHYTCAVLVGNGDIGIHHGLLFLGCRPAPDGFARRRATVLHTPEVDDAMKLPARITLCEVGTRDGFQIEPDFIPTEQKVEVVNLLSAAGLPRIEVTSFVHPKAVPQLRDAEEVMARITRRRGIRYAALVPNEKGAVRAIEAGVDAIHTVLSASESHNLANVNMTIAESLDRLGAVMRVAAAAKLHVGCGVSTSFGCPFEGDVPLAQLERIVGRLVEMGARAVGLADTTGMANPRQVGRVLERLIPRFPGIEWTLHTHYTRAMAIPNILAAMEHGVTNFDASIGGLGGCPFAPGASGNVCTEDLVHCLHAMGVQTGIDLDRLVGVSRRVQEIVGRALPGQIVKAGPSTRKYPVPDTVAGRIPRAG